MSLCEIQCRLDAEGASDLVVELVIQSGGNPSIFSQAVELGIALLEGGNPTIQDSIFRKLCDMNCGTAHDFFKVRELPMILT
jgi:inositol 1,4,5-triphosphate receptor type 1